MRFVRVVATHAQEVLLLPRPRTGPLAVLTRLPVPQLRTMALAAKPVGLFEVDEPAVGKVQLVAVLRIVAVETPTILLVVLEDDVVAVDRMRCSVDLVGRKMAAGAREDPFGKGRRSNRDRLVRRADDVSADVAEVANRLVLRAARHHQHRP